MRTAVADTSLRAYDSLRERGELTNGQRRVMLVFHRYPQETFTRAELSQRSSIPLQTCCGRVRELLDMGYLEELTARPCTVTGNPSHPLRIPKSIDTATAQPAPEKRVADDPPEKPGSSRAAVIHIGGKAVEVVDERMVQAHGRSAKGLPIEFSYVAVTVRDVKPRRAA